MNNFKIKLKNFYENKYFKAVWKVFLTLLGTLILSFASGVFLVPFKIVSGGINGVGILLADAGILDVDTWQYIFYWGLFVIGSFLLGFKFTINTLISTIFYPVFLSIFIGTEIGIDIVNLLAGTNCGILENGVLAVESSAMAFIDSGRIILVGIFGGALVGLGCGITFIGGGSTGGIDIVAFIINKYTGISVSGSTFFLDATVVFAGLIIDIVEASQGVQNTNFLAGLVGIIGAFMCSYMIETVYNGRNSAYLCDVITSKPEELRDFISTKVNRSTTIFKVEGGYTKEEKTMVRIVFSKREYVKVKDAIAKIDPNAFTTYTLTKLVHGEGFSENISSKSNTLTEANNLLSKFKVFSKTKKTKPKEENKEEEKENDR